MKILNIAIFMGGRTAEHEISLKSGSMVLNSLDKNKYNIKPVIIQKNGLWKMPKGFHSKSGKSNNIYRPGEALDQLIKEKVDVVFLAMHGPYGEDGTIQGLLEMADIPYTGSNVLASSLAMNKIKTLEIYEYYGLRTPKRVTFTRWDWPSKKNEIISKIKDKLGVPCVIKPVQLGSSVATFIVKKEKDIAHAVREVVRRDVAGLAEEYIQGEEVTCAVLGGNPGEEPTALPTTLIIPKGSTFFDYKAKYTPGASNEITPAPIGAKLTRQVQTIAVKAHKILGCGSMSRTDMIIRKGKIYLLETNTIPGMTETSLYPQAARAAGMTIPQLYDKVIQLALLYHHAGKSMI